MTINRNGPDKLGRTFQSSGTEIQVNLLNRKRAQLDDKTNERRGATMMRSQQHTSMTANKQQHEDALTKSRTSRTIGHRHVGHEPAAEAAPSQPKEEVWTSTEDLFWDHMREVQNKWNTLKLNDDIWAKLIYFEQNRRLAKAYVSTPVLTIDGSTNGLDGFRIGLSGIENSYRDLDSIACLRSIGQGIKLKIDHQGNILVKKLVPAVQRRPQATSGCPVLVKEWPSSPMALFSCDDDDSALNAQVKSQEAPLGFKAPIKSSSNTSNYSQLSSSSYSSSSGSSPSRNSFESHHHLRSSNSATSGRNSHLADQAAADWPMQEISDPDRTYKLFDMQKFRVQLDRSRRRAERNLVDGTTTTPIDWRQCVSIISFNRGLSSRLNKPIGLNVADANQEQVLSDPCWLMLINIIAIDMLKSSVCDSISSPSPQSQTSSLINRHQNDNLRMAARKLLPPLPVTDDKLAPISCASSMNQYDQQQQMMMMIRSLEQPELKSERLRRLNRKRYEGEPATTLTNLSGANKRVDNSKLSQQQPEGSIYTTFTGKYLDKQHKRRANEIRTRQESAKDFELERGPHLVMSKMSERKSSKANNSRNSMELSQHAHRLSAATRPNPSGLGKRLPTGGNQLTHSLSTFDLSHGLKLNLRSINTSSIKMNFDDSDDQNDHDHVDVEQEDLDDCDKKEHDGGLQMLAKRRGDAQEDLFSKLKLKTTKEKTLASFVRNQRKTPRSPQEAGSEWIDLAKKYASIRDSNGANTGDKQLDEYENKNNQSYTKDDGKENEAPSKSNASNMQQNKSRSSIASSSSGCADNDYFNSQSSQSSPSSMSSSTTRSNGAEELTSQPASSSGINSASDDYERCEPKQQTDDGIDIEPTEIKAMTNYQADQAPKRRSSNTSNHQRGTTTTKLADSSEMSHIEDSHHMDRRKNVKKAISLSRGNNGKSLNLSPAESEFNCKDCQNLDKCNDQEQCDCGAPTCDRMMFTLDEQMSSPHEICDCYCDCLFHQPNEQTASVKFAHQIICQDELLCDCGAAGDIGDPVDLSSLQRLNNKEEPIYDHLPRFGLANREAPTSGPSGWRAADAWPKSPKRRGSVSRQDPLGEVDDCIVQLPASTLDGHQAQHTKLDAPLKKSTSATNLKRTGWLEGSRYMKLLPRFMSFGSKGESYSNRKLPSMEKSGTLDRAGHLVSRFTRSRSSQNLTK